MKRLTVWTFLVAIMFNADAQLANTKWRNIINIPEPYETFLQFQKDTVTVNLVSDGTLIETMSYATSKDTLRITKLFGNSPCDERVTGTYHFEINDDKLTITLLSDDCLERANALKTNNPWLKEKI
jgi:hypothetical protein